MNGNVFRPVAIVTGVVLLLIIGFGIFRMSEKNEQLENLLVEKEQLSDNIENRDSTINELMFTFNEIDENLQFIKTRRNQLSLEASKEMNVNRKSAILQDIRLMDSMLVASSRHIEDLEKRLKDSGVRMRSFENRIAALNKTLSENGAEIEELRILLNEKDYRIADLSTQIEMFQTVVEEKESMLYLTETSLAEKQSQLNTAFYTMGSFRELKEHGILSRTGGLLGIGSTKTVSSNLTNDYFTALNIRETTTIPISSKVARIITEHPDDSYDFIIEDGLISALVIENPDEFWRISKYAVIETR
jgi:predicted  nucleic acid-binding Zn-ribbon protein